MNSNFFKIYIVPLACSFAAFQQEFAQLAQKYQMNWQMNDASKLKRVLIVF
jgi:formyltetrahydrofolate hydrolase